MTDRSQIFLNLLALALAIALPSSVEAQGNADTPESAIRGFMRAMYSADPVAFQSLADPDPRIRLLIAGGAANKDALRELVEDRSGLQIIPLAIEMPIVELSPGELRRLPTGGYA